MPTPATPLWRAPWRLPATLVNGLSIGLGMLVSTALIAWCWGLPAAAIASSGFGAVSVADNVCAPRGKLAAMLPAGLGALTVTLLVALSQGHPSAQVAMVLAVTFTSLLWTAWGKRGLPQSFAMILTLVFQMAAFSEGHMGPAEAQRHVGWVAVGVLAMVGWSQLSALVLASRYRTLALADSLLNLSRLIATQARWTHARALAHGPSEPPKPASTEAASADNTSELLTLIRQQAGLADVFQSARDLLYGEATHADSLRRRRQIDALIQLINLRDVVLACQLDIDQLVPSPASRTALLHLARDLKAHADHVAALAESVRLGTALPQAAPAQVHPAQAPAPTHPDAHLHSLARRAAHLGEQAQHLDAALRGDTSSPHPEAAQLRTLVSPNSWPLAPLLRQLHGRAPVLRYALRTTLAMACALLISRWLPWHSHPHWLLMTVAVVMRGNLEQTLARRDARILGTFAGCALASVLLWAHPSTPLLFAILALALSLAHSYVQRDYRVTTAAGAVMALVQAHLFAHSPQAAWLDVAERLFDTLMGAGLAWGFSYVLPSWERGQMPALVARLRQAQAQYARQVLRWHEVHAQTPQRNHARREVYDTLWLLAQALQRTDKEPAYARGWTPQIEAMLIRSHRLIAQLAGVKIFLTRRQAELQPELTQRALQATEASIEASLGSGHTVAQAAAPDASALSTTATTATTTTPGDDGDPDLIVAHDLPSPDGDPTPWLLRRLAHIEAEARAWAQAAAGITPRR